MREWERYQVVVAEFFRDLGMQARLDTAVSGTRTTHDIDVLVSGSYVGFDITWIVECKAWQTRVTKEKVLTLRQIVNDVGADRGFLLAENGFQAGALEAALLSNVTLTSIAELTERLSYDLNMAKLSKLEHRAERALREYVGIDKQTRIDANLRPSVDGGTTYSAIHVIDTIEASLREVRLRGFPLYFVGAAASELVAFPRAMINGPRGATSVDGPAQLYELLDGRLTDLEDRLNRVIRPEGNV